MEFLTVLLRPVFDRTKKDARLGAFEFQDRR
jgi:hypothetical protein